MELNDKKNLDKLRTAITENLAELGVELGLILKADRCSYDRDGESCSFKVEIRTLTADPLEVKDFKKYCTLWAADGLKPEHLGASMLNKGKSLKLVGLNMKSRKHPLLFEEDGSGRRFGFTISAVKWLKIEQGEAA